MLSKYEKRLRDWLLSAPVTQAPAPWRAVFPAPRPVAGIVGVGFAPDPTTGRDLLMVVSHEGRGVFNASTGRWLARDGDPDPELSTPSGPDLCCPGLGPLEGTWVRMTGLLGGGLHTVTRDGWTVDVVSPEWPHQRVLLSADGGLFHGSAGDRWWLISRTHHTELRAAGFSPSGRTLVVATSSHILLLTRAGR